MTESSIEPKSLGRVSIFSTINEDVLNKLASETRLIRLPQGHLVRGTRRDTVSVDGLYILKSGIAKVTRSSQSWEAEAVLAILHPGQCFGEIGLIDGLPPSANVVTMEAMECYFLPRKAFVAALEQNPEIALGMLPALATMVRGADQWIAELL